MNKNTNNMEVPYNAPIIEILDIDLCNNILAGSLVGDGEDGTFEYE